MTPRVLSTAILTVLVVVPCAMAQSETSVVNDPDKNGWTLRASFAGDPDSYARAGHAWTLPRARRMAEQVRREYPNAIRVQIVGRDGDGRIDPAKGPHPHLPEWAMIEQKFRGMQKDATGSTLKRLNDVGDHYRKAKEITDAWLRKRQHPTGDAEKELQTVRRDYNAKADEFVRNELKGRPHPLPRIAPANLGEFAREWDEAKRDQYLAETAEASVERRRADFQGLKEELDREQKTGKDVSVLEERIEKESVSIAQDQKVADQLATATAGRLNQLENSLADASGSLPAADAFVQDPEGATYTQDDTPRVFKTDKDGNPLPDDRQPPGYPKPYDREGKLGADEKVLIDPLVKVKPLALNPGKVTAGVTGKVVGVDKEGGRVDIEVDEAGTKVLIGGIDPSAVRVGDFVEPRTPLGGWRRSSGSYQLTIRTVNKRNQYVRAGPVLNYARKPAVQKGSLRREPPTPDHPPLNPKAKVETGAGGKTDQAKIAFDDTREKGANLKATGTGSDRRQKLASLEAKELVARRELERQKEQTERQQDEARVLKTRKGEVDAELETLVKQLDQLEAEKQKLESEKAALRKTVQDTAEAFAKRAKSIKKDAVKIAATGDNRAIDEFNRTVVLKHNEDVDRKSKELLREEYRIQDAEKSLQKKRGEVERRKKSLDVDAQAIAAKLSLAEAKASSLQSAQAKTQEKLDSYAKERADLEAKLKESK